MNTLLTPEQSRPYENLPPFISPDLVSEGMAAYLQFLNLPLQERLKIYYIDPDKPRTGQAGYEEKTHATQDNKHVFHMTTSLARKFDGQTDRLAHEARQFYEAARELHTLFNCIGKMAIDTWAEAENFGQLPRLLYPNSRQLNHHTRFVAYLGGRGTVLAGAHYDKSIATMAVAESHAGLRVGYGPDDLTLLERNKFQPIIFPGYGWHQLTSQAGLETRRQPAWHDVVDVGNRVNDNICRWALIHFLNPSGIELGATTDQTHTPLNMVS